MEKKHDIFLEIILRNSTTILTQAEHQLEYQQHMLHHHKSSDHTADAALDNIYGGSVTIDSKGGIRKLRNVQAWANIIRTLQKKYQAQENQLDYQILHLTYIENRNNRNVMGILHITRQKLFKVKQEIKNFVLAAACEMGIYKVLEK